MKEKLCEYIRDNFTVDVDVIYIAANLYDKARDLYGLSDDYFNYDGVAFIADVLECIGITEDEISSILLTD